MNTSPIVTTVPLGFPWQTVDPFLFCVHHLDHFPAGRPDMSIDPAHLVGRNIGNDFVIRDGFRMYHGDTYPGFPGHPHRGFETITIARHGFIDHSDSLGARARFGRGDVQWMTAGKGVVHSEMFPLLNEDGPNTGELFQIWLNLPRDSKMVEPHFKMLWNEDIPDLTFDSDGKTTHVRVIAGALGDSNAPAPPPDSWAAREDAGVAIWTLQLQSGASFTLPAGPEDAQRILYFFEGSTVSVAGKKFAPGTGIQIEPSVPVEIDAHHDAELLMLQGRPIGEPVAQHGPFVMNYPGEIKQAFADYQATRFGGWPWPTHAPVHPKDAGRFADRGDGHRETPPTA